MKQIMTKSIKASRSNYQFKAIVNYILIIIGIVLIANPIAYMWSNYSNNNNNNNNNNSLDMFNYFLGGLGIVTLISTFFNNPQNRMSIAIADLIQLHLICNMYSLQFHGIVGKLTEISYEGTKNQDKCRLSDIEKINSSLCDLTMKAVELIDKCIEKNARKDISYNTSISSDTKGNITDTKQEKLEENKTR